MKKQQRNTTLTLLKLLKVAYDRTEESSLWRGKLLDGFTAAICSINELEYDDPISHRICLITAAFTRGQYRVSECIKQIENELKVFEQLPGKKRCVRG